MARFAFEAPPPLPIANTSCAFEACVVAAVSNNGRQPRSPATRAVVGCVRPLLVAIVAAPGNDVVGIA